MYIGTSCGKIIGRRGSILELILKKNGYLHFSKSEGYGRPNQTLVHRFIWEYFNGPIPNHLHVDHIDGDKTNNNLDNLQLLTPADNSRKSSAKLSIEDVVSIKKDLTSGESGANLSRKFNISPQVICDIKKGRRWANIKIEEK